MRNQRGHCADVVGQKERFDNNKCEENTHGLSSTIESQSVISIYEVLYEYRIHV